MKYECKIFTSYCLPTFVKYQTIYHKYNDKTIKMLEVSTTCRSCMKTSDDLVDLFVPLNIDNCTYHLADVLMTTASIEVSKEDGLPQRVCKECSNFLQEVQIFRTRALHCEEKLKKLCAIQSEVKNEVDFKNETLTGNFDFDDYDFDQCDVFPKVENYLMNKVKDEMYICNICQKAYIDNNDYLKHLSSHSRPSFVCSSCNKSFRKESSLKKHVERSCLNKKSTECGTLEDISVKIETEDLQFKCPNCPLTFAKYRSLLSHNKKHKAKHKENNSYQCDYCSKKFKMKSVLLRHIKLHSSSGQYQCTECPKKYSRQDQLEEHMHKHTGRKPHICSHCGKAFSQICSLKDHIRTHTKEAPYLCSECGKRFTNSSNLRQHLVRHTGQKPFSCNLCPKTFYTKGQMKVHVASHAGVHAYECPECGAALTTSSSLKKHRLIHLNIKPHACDTCAMRFSDRDHLKRHQRIHTGEKPYRCTHCERAFAQSNDLAKHLRTHVGQNIYQCTICEMKFRLLSELKQHYPVHYLNGNNSSQMPNDHQVVSENSVGEMPTNVQNLENGEASKSLQDLLEQTEEAAKPTGGTTTSNNHITITFNDIINKAINNSLSSGITINISPAKD